MLDSPHSGTVYPADFGSCLPLATLRQAGVVLEDVEVHKADLEDVFLDLMAQQRQEALA